VLLEPPGDRHEQARSDERLLLAPTSQSSDSTAPPLSCATLTCLFLQAL